MPEPLFLKPCFKEKIWGGNKLKNIFNYKIPSDHTGECWAISAHKNGLSLVLNGKYKNMTLNNLWKYHKELFGNPVNDEFPLLVKIIDAHDNLSIQVHPNDVYAKKFENSLGKSECWYVVHADSNSFIYYGHNAKDYDELTTMIENHNWNRLLRKVKVHTGDFFYIPSGTIHAIGKGVIILETQQSSDVTYRVYDFDRVDSTTGKKRALHLKKAKDNIIVPFVYKDSNYVTYHINDVLITQFIETNFFNVYKWELNGGFGEFKRTMSPYNLVSVIDGNGSLIVDNKKFILNKGMHFILPFDVKKWIINGSLKLIVSDPN